VIPGRHPQLCEQMLKEVKNSAAVLVPNALLGLSGRTPMLFKDLSSTLGTESGLIATAVALGADRVAPWSKEEIPLARASRTNKVSRKSLGILRELIRAGYDPLGEAFCALRSCEERRESGATYTPVAIVQTMVDWAAQFKAATRIIDPGVGSARFLIAAGSAFPKAQLVGIDTDPVATLMARANVAVAGLAERAHIIRIDYRDFKESVEGSTLYIGNPPYVRHHQITASWKQWLFKEADKLGLCASKLAGLHVHFFLATARNAKEGDFGAFITAAEWLDVNYGSLLRSLVLNRLGGQGITVIEPTAHPFPDAATTAAITTFEIASKPTSVFFRRVATLRDFDGLNKGRRVHRDRLCSESRWSFLTRSPEKPPEGYVELGELCRVHRGQVTGANHVWIAGEHSIGLPESVLFRSVTRARELFDAHGVLDNADKLRSVIDLPIDLDQLGPRERKAVEAFLKIAKMMGANKGYVASHRKAWWSVGLRQPAPIISTYMARRPPAFVLNIANARHINIAHGLYPREPMSEKAQITLIQYMQVNISQRSGRTYAGGLTKFEPREMERLAVPGPAMLVAGVM
jgi:adenine-specific DNA-methyltransferase